MSCDSTMDITSDDIDYRLTLQSREPLFPFPAGDLTADDFTLKQVMKLYEMNDRKLQIEIKLISPNEFRINPFRHNEHFIEIFRNKKRMKRRSNKELKHAYELDVRHYKHVISSLQRYQEDYGITVNYNKLDKEMMNALMANSHTNDTIMTYIMNSDRERDHMIASLEDDTRFTKAIQYMNSHDMFVDLTDHQKISFFTAISRNGKCILRDSFGKSLTALTIMTYFRDEWPLIIVCDADRKTYWAEEIDVRLVCAKDLKVSVADTVADVYCYPEPFHDILIMDYELYYELMDTISFRCVGVKAYIFEDQSRGTENRRQWKGLSTCFEHLKDAKRLLFVSTESGFNLDEPKNLYPMLRILDPKTFADFTDYYERYCDKSDETQHKRNARELEILLRSTFVSPIAFDPN